MELSLREYCEAAYGVVEAMESITTIDKTDSWALSNWILEECNQSSSDVYLSHPSIITSQFHGNETSSLNEDDHNSLLEDSTVFLDPQSCCFDESQNLKISIQWNFSIVYSHTYRVPVLYFRVQDLEGTPCRRSQVLEWLPRQSVADNWDFVSQEEHPITGFPSFFLHPCKTSARLGKLKSNDERVSFLWAWMSMVFPAVNQAIPPSYFRAVLNSCDEIAQTQKSNT